mmetsp:Transcript_98911/g.295393  ORF Transcript_98911/g.295393 Transcript_98911/m.295393 type:complete len:230 (-) Transcript_98911:651-1340(-)
MVPQAELIQEGQHETQALLRLGPLRHSDGQLPGAVAQVEEARVEVARQPRPAPRRCRRGLRSSNAAGVADGFHDEAADSAAVASCPTTCLRPLGRRSRSAFALTLEARHDARGAGRRVQVEEAVQDGLRLLDVPGLHHHVPGHAAPRAEDLPLGVAPPPLGAEDQLQAIVQPLGPSQVEGQDEVPADLREAEGAAQELQQGGSTLAARPPGAGAEVELVGPPARGQSQR